MNILFLGNSYSEDTAEYLPKIAEEFKKDLYLEVLVYPGCSINQHIDFLTNHKPLYIHRTYDFISSSWQVRNEVSANEVIKSKLWDYIVIQQCSAESGMIGTYSRINELIEITNNLSTNKNVKYIWNMTWAWPDFNEFDQKKEFYENSSLFMHKGIIRNVNDFIVNNNNISSIFPVGKAIWFAKTYYKDEQLFRDAVHLSLDIGRFIASLVAFNSLFNEDIRKVIFIPDNVKNEDKFKCIEIVQKSLL